MASPPGSPNQLQGASRTSGGISRGRAIGNVFNYGDLKDSLPLMLGPVKGKIYLFISKADPATINPSRTSPSMTFKQIVSASLTSILTKMVQSYSPIKTSNHCIFVYEEGLWVIKGRFESAIKENDDVEWTINGTEYSLHILLSSFEPMDTTGIEHHASSSVSVSRFSTPASGHQTPISEATSTVSGAASSIPSARLELMTKLGISEHLANRSGFSLPLAYQKYLGYLKAVKTLESMVAAGTWSGNRPTGTDVIEIFVSRSMWFDSYRPTFSKVHTYPTMVAWLEDEADAPGNLEAWGVERAKYTFKDLAEFLKNGGRLNEEEDKGKSKEKKNKDKGQRANIEAKGEVKSSSAEKKSKRKAKKAS
ncbi:hypothetical protein DXG01_012275, partial [Tephrocybe rancida]